MRFAPSRRLASILAVALTLSMVGCAGGPGALHAPPAAASGQQISLPELDPKLRDCFAGVVTLPKDATWSKALTQRVLAQLIQADGDKTDCGRRAIAFYDDLREKAAK
jgi:hypothetical protein